jgi:ABC-2 type transport system ATP-binding protein
LSGFRRNDELSKIEEEFSLTENNNDKPLIEIRELHKRFGRIHAVRGISFSVRKGEVLGFLGPNGAGKSTTMKMITGFLEPTSGYVSIAGMDIHDQPIAIKKKIGYLPEGAPLYGEMTVTAFLNFVADVRGMQGAAREQRIEEVIRKINLESVRQQTLETLSKGYKRRVGVAQAILHDPEILIMDEPTDGLDPNQKHEVRTLIKEMASDKAIVISTHILEEVDAICTRAIIIASGKMLFDGTPAELLSRSTNGKLDDVFREITTQYYSELGAVVVS